MDFMFVGPMPADAFLSHFLRPKTTPNAPSGPCFTTGKAVSCSDELIRIIEESKVSQHLRFTNIVALKNATIQEARLLPHVAISCDRDEPITSTAGAVWDAFLELPPEDEDPFKDPATEDDVPRHKVPFCKESEKLLMHLRRMNYLAHDMFKTRSRNFAFSGIILGDKARLIRWDRSGAVVTELFCWHTEDSPLARFLRVFDELSYSQRGFDPTVSLPSPDEIALTRAALKRSNITDEFSDDAMRKFSVRDQVTNKERFYVAGPPQTRSHYLAGRATTGYIAVDLADSSLVWLKDSWRLLRPCMRTESAIYRLLTTAKIPHIPPLLGGGDVEDQRTRSQEFVKAPWACESHGVTAHVHHRLVLAVVGRPLKDFKSTLELCTAVRDALEAHSKAFTELNILHGDISGGNILITDDGHGILIDWDLSIDLTQEERTQLTGTWQFISASLLDNRRKKLHKLRDDLESFVHVFIYHLIRYRPTGVFELARFIDKVYRPYDPDDEPYRSSVGKSGFFMGAYICNDELEGHLNDNLYHLTQGLRRVFYRGLYSDEWDLEPGMRQEALDRLETPCYMLSLFDAALEKTGWADDDGSMDMLLREDEEHLQGADPRISTGKRPASIAVGDAISRSSKRRCRSTLTPKSSKGLSGELLRSGSSSGSKTSNRSAGWVSTRSQKKAPKRRR